MGSQTYKAMRHPPHKLHILACPSGTSQTPQDGVCASHQRP
jgi:hypothetical protein